VMGKENGGMSASVAPIRTTCSKNSYHSGMKTVVSEKDQITIPKTLMERLGIDFSPLTLETALEASKAWKTYRQQGGNARELPLIS